MLYVVDSSESNEKLEKFKGWLEFHIDEAFKAAEVTDSETDECEFLFPREKLLPSKFSNMFNNICQCS